MAMLEDADGDDMASGLFSEDDAAAFDYLLKSTAETDLVEVMDADSNMVGCYNRFDASWRWPDASVGGGGSEIRLQESVPSALRR